MAPSKQDVANATVKPGREIWSFAIAALLAGFYLVTSLYLASRRPYWFDEVVTFLFAHMSSVPTIWKAVVHIDPWVPVPAYIVVHFFQSIFGTSQIATRLPATVSLMLGLLITFDCSRRLSNGLHGLLAVALLSCTFLPYYGYEARSYGMYFMFAAAALWLWAHTGASKVAIALFCLVFFCATAVHTYAMLCILPYAISDLLSRRLRGFPSVKVFAGALGICFALGVLAIQLLAIHRGSNDFPGPHPSFEVFQNVYSEVFPAGLFLLALIAIWIVLLRRDDKPAPILPMQPAEQVGWLCFSIPIFGFILANTVTHAFASRYFIGMLPGIAVAFACLIWRYFNRVRAIALGIVILLISVGTLRQLQVVRHPELIDIYGQQTQTRRFLKLESTLWDDGKKYILWSGNFLYLPAHYYSHHQERYVFFRSDDERERAAMIIPLGFTPYYPYRIWTIKDLKEHAAETAVINPRPGTLAAMQQADFQASIPYTDPIKVVYFK
jgi:hypothetical protein